MAHVDKENSLYYKSGAAAEKYRQFVPGHLYLYLYKNTHVIELIGLKDELAAVQPTYINDAVVTATLKDESGNQIAGQTWPLSLPYVTSSNGDYRANLTHDLTVLVGQRLWAEIEAVANQGRLYRRVPVLVAE